MRLNPYFKFKIHGFQFFFNKFDDSKISIINDLGEGNLRFTKGVKNG